MKDRFELLAPEVVADPHPVLDRMRVEAPVYWVERAKVWFFTRYDDVAAVLRDHQGFSSQRVDELLKAQMPEELRSEMALLAEGMSMSFVFMDPPLHRVIRSHVAGAFTPLYLEQLRPRIQRVIDELLDTLRPAGEMDVVRDLAAALPVRVVAELFGVPGKDSMLFQRWSLAMNRLLGLAQQPDMTALRGVQAELVTMTLYFLDLVAKRHADPGDDIISKIVTSQHADPEFDRTYVVPTCNLLMFGGFEMVQNMVANTVMLLWTHRDQLELVRADPTLVRSALEEALRYEPPGASWGRRATRAVEMGGREIREGDQVLVSYAAANRDPSQFADPHRFDVLRTPNPHLSFSAGIHHCIGAPLARMQGQMLLTSLLERMPNLRLMPLPDGDVRWHAEDLGMRVLRTLPARF